MRILTLSCPGNIHEAALFVSNMHLARFLLHLAPISGGSGAIAVFRLECYPDYLHYCKLLGREEPMTAEQFFGVYRP